MSRRLIAAIGIIAFVIAYLPGVAEGSDTQLASCCTGMMCPMHLHHHAADHSDCGMVAMSGSHAGMCSCPATDLRHPVVLVFVLPAPHIALSVRLTAAHNNFALPFAPDVALDTSSPPPRSLVA
jgi:hypothetical protein